MEGRVARLMIYTSPKDLASRGASSADQTERVTRRIQVDTKATVLGRLMIVAACPQIEDRWLGRVDVTDGEVQVELLRVGSARPGRSHPVVDPLKREGWATVGMVRRHTAHREA